MKKYLFGLGAMLVGAGLMFIFTHTEVSAESEENKPEPFACSRKYVGDYDIQHCETGYLDCAVTSSGVSCVKSGGLFK
jgi:NAD(P)H-hydrate repair Nnr-like enzyme with NAD(P)H-hydrate dehydratase domain